MGSTETPLAALQRLGQEFDGLPPLCWACGSKKTTAQLEAEGYVACCPERTVNDMIDAAPQSSTPPTNKDEVR